MIEETSYDVLSIDLFKSKPREFILPILKKSAISDKEAFNFSIGLNSISQINL
jgi:hypothetical protein